MSMNKTWAISSWISFLISVDILSGALRLHEFRNRASFLTRERGDDFLEARMVPERT